MPIDNMIFKSSPYQIYSISRRPEYSYNNAGKLWDYAFNAQYCAAALINSLFIKEDRMGNGRPIPARDLEPFVNSGSGRGVPGP